MAAALPPSPAHVTSGVPVCTQSSFEHLPALHEVVERLGLGWTQLRVLLAGGGVHAVAGSVMMLACSVTAGAADSWGAGPFGEGALFSALFTGIIFGNIACGPLGIMYGRKQLLTFCLISVFLLSCLSALARGPMVLESLRLLTGISLGVGLPAWTALGAEVTPSGLRIVLQALSQSFFAVGELFACCLLVYNEHSALGLDYRWLMVIGSFPSALFAVAVQMLRESPSYLAGKGLDDQAKSVLEAMRNENGLRDSVSVEFRPCLRPLGRQEQRWVWFWHQLRAVFGAQLWLTSAVLMYTCFVINFFYYGCLYAFPHALPDMVALREAETTAVELAIGAALELPGSLLGLVVGIAFSRRTAVLLYLVLSLCSALAFAAASATGPYAQTVQLTGFYGCKCFVHVGFVAVYQCAVETYAEAARTTGAGVVLGCGRLAGVFVPFYYQILKEVTGGSEAFFYLMAVCLALNIVLVFFLPRDCYRGKGYLPDISQDWLGVGLGESSRLRRRD